MRIGVVGAGIVGLPLYCAEHDLRYEEIGKVVVATGSVERAGLDVLEQRARRNGVPGLARLGPAQLRALEPHVRGVAALHSPRSAICDFPAVARRLATDLGEAGGRLLLRHPVTGLSQVGDRVSLHAAGRAHVFDYVVVCAGLGTDPLASAAGLGGDVRIVPFRGEYYRLAPDARHLVRGLVYPVPHPRYPFLGVHLTPQIGGEVLAGPNALLALAREGYRWRDVSIRDLYALAAWPGTRRLARRHWRAGLAELPGSLSRRCFARAAQRYVPELGAQDLFPAPSGVRAQAVDARGELADDFRVQVDDRVLMVRNAPSPAATSSLAIARYLVSGPVGRSLR